MLKSFKLVTESTISLPFLLKETQLSLSGFDAKRHIEKYLKPFFGGKKKNTHTLGRDFEGLKTGTPLTVISSKQKEGKYYTTVSIKGKKYDIPNNRINKPKDLVKDNSKAGLNIETKLVNRLKKLGLMDPELKAAGSTGGVDFHLLHANGTKFGGSEHDQIGGEFKISLAAKFGSLVIHHDPKKGWHISDKTRARKPHLAAAYDKVRIGRQSLLQYINANAPIEPVPTKYKDWTIPQRTNDLSPLHAYTEDHGVDVLHVHTHGTFRTGLSKNRDRTGVGFPAPKGEAYFRVQARPKVGTELTFRLSKLEKSNIDLMNDEHIPAIRKALGYDQPAHKLSNLVKKLKTEGIIHNISEKILREVVVDNSHLILIDENVVPELIDESAQDKYSLEQHHTASKKLRHLQHLEDLMLIGGKEGYSDIVDSLQKTHDYLQGKGRNGYSIQTKFDGSPSVIWGHKDGKFFVGTKSFFNKVPKINFTDKDIDINHGVAPRLAEKLKFLLKELKPISPKEGIYQGDLMYTADEIAQNEKNISFTPNTLTYNVDKNSYQGQKIMKSKIGIAAHTHYEQDKNGDMHAVFSPIDFSKFKDSEHINFLSTALRGPFDYKAKDQSSFINHLQKAAEVQKKIDSTNGFDAVKNHERLLLAYANSTIKAKKENSVEGYISFLNSQYKKRIDSLKTDKSKNSIKSQLDDEIKNIITNKANFENIFKVHKHIQNAKNVLTNVLGRNSPYHETVLGSPSKPEGFVVTVNGNPIKFVDRQHFSAANFDWNTKVNPDDNPLVLSYGRMNPPTIGHEKLINKGSDIARRIGAKQEVVATRSQDKDKNPLTPAQKLSWLKTMFPGKNTSIAAPDSPTLIAQLQHYANQGVKDLTMVVGDDRVKDFQGILAKYNGPGKLFNFHRARVISAGERDPDAEGAEGMSASKMRAAAKANDFKTFRTGIPSHVKDDKADTMFHDLRASMGVVQINSTTSGHSLSIYSKRNDKIGQDSKQEIARRKRAGTWKGN